MRDFFSVNVLMVLRYVKHKHSIGMVQHDTMITAMKELMREGVAQSLEAERLTMYLQRSQQLRKTEEDHIL